MAFLSRLFRRDDPLAEREEAHRQGMRDARRHPLGEFTDPQFQPAYVTEIRARAREEITEVDRRLAATRTALLERALGEREAILRELGRSDTRPEPPAYANGHTAATGPDASADPFITIAESRARRAEARRRAVVEESNAGVQRARARIEHLTQEWESALIERDHEVEAVYARAERLIAAYKSGVLRNHPRKEEIPSLWKGEVIAMDATSGSAAAVSGREEIGRILREVEARIEVWHAEVLPRELPPDHPRPQLSPAPAPDPSADPPDPRPDPPSDHSADPPPDQDRPAGGGATGGGTTGDSLAGESRAEGSRARHSPTPGSPAPGSQEGDAHAGGGQARDGRRTGSGDDV
ncbi:hypothetical protein ACBJ59_20980 [Nonomuraea sp. MTCD27]|uniref:hypothetical protein n=1 Tax=Nonomuraea sp. MTCD27 TaxID=1676747 RepID=UPI0035C02761